MALTRAQFQRELFPGIRELIFRKFKEYGNEWETVFRVLSSESAFEEDNEIAGVGLFKTTGENEEVAQDSFLPGFPKRYQHVDYTLSIGASPQIRRDEKTGFWRQRTPDLGFSARQTKEIMHAGYIEGGFTTSLGPDGVSLFNAAHPNVRVGTQSNLLSPIATISVLSVRIALTQFRRFFDNTGIRRQMVMPKWLAHPPELEYDVLEILRSAGRPDTANRADNVIRNKLEPFTWDYLLNTKFWYVFTDKGSHYIKHYDRVKFTVREWLDDPTEIQWVAARYAESFGHSHWIGTLGSNPV